MTFEAARRKAIAASLSSEEVLENAPTAWPREPVPPIAPTRVLSDVTYEGILQYFEEGHPSIGVLMDEGGAFFGGHGMSRENRLKTAASFSKLWDGAPLNRTRAGSPQRTYRGRRTCCHFMVQPDVGDQILSDPMLRDQGLVSRLLMAWPESTIGSRIISRQVLQSDAMAEADSILAEHHSRLGALLGIAVETAEEDSRVLKPRVLRLTPEAHDLLLEFANTVERAQGEEGVLRNITGFASKAAEQAVRLAGNLTIYADPHVTDISYSAMLGGVKLMDWYLYEANRLLDAGEVSVHLKQAQLLLDWLQDRSEFTFIDVRTIVQRGPGSIRDTQTVRALCKTLQEEGWLAPCPEPVLINGTRVKSAWHVVRK